MTILPQGKIAPAAAGTPQALPAAPNGALVAGILIAQIAGTTGIVYFGKSNMVKATLVGVARQFLPPGASGFLDSEEFLVSDSNTIDPTAYGVDAANNNEGVLVTYLQN